MKWITVYCPYCGSSKMKTVSCPPDYYCENCNKTFKSDWYKDEHNEWQHILIDRDKDFVLEKSQFYILGYKKAVKDAIEWMQSLNGYNMVNLGTDEPNPQGFIKDFKQYMEKEDKQ